MKQYIEAITDELTAAPLAGAEVWVYDDDNNVAVLFAADGTTEIDNPLTTNEDGEFSFYNPTTELTAVVYYGGRLRRRLRLLVGGGYSIAAATSAHVAEAFAGPTYDSTAEGLAATAVGQSFAVYSAGVTTVYVHEAGPVATEIRKALSPELLASSTGGEMVGVGETNVATITPATPQASGAVADGTTNDYAALVAARDACWANNLASLAIPDAEYAIGSSLELAKDHWACIPMGDNARIKHTGSGAAITLSPDDPAAGTYRGSLGGVGPLVIEGNANTTRLLEIDNFHQGSVNVDLKNGQVGVYVTDSIGTAGTAGAVLTHFKVRVSQGNDGPFTTRPATGFYASKIYGCQCDLLIEHCGGSGNFGVYLNSSAANIFYGTSEGNLSGGVLIASNSYRNTFIGFFCEFNGTGFDWDIRGDYNRLINCTGVASAGNEISGDYNVLEGGKFEDLTITNAAAYTVLDGVDLIGSFTDNSTTTTIRNCRLDGTPIPDKAPRPGGALTMGTNIADYSLSDPSFQACAYWRLPDGTGQIAGTFNATGAISIGDTIATIPAGYRPAARVMFAAVNFSTNALIGLTVDSAGNVQTRTAISGGNVFGALCPPFARG